jgi:hypothetical protein
MLAVAGWLPVRSVAAAGRQASNELRKNTTLTTTAADELWSRPGGGLGIKSRAGRHPRAPPEAVDDASRPESWSWNGSANCEASVAQAVAPLADKSVLTVLYGALRYGIRYTTIPRG